MIKKTISMVFLLSLTLFSKANAAEDKTDFVVFQPITIKSGEQIKSRLLSLANDERLKNFDLGKIAAIGEMKTKTEDGKNVLTIDWKSISRTDLQKEISLPTPLKSTLSFKNTKIANQTKLPAYGNVDSLVYAIQSAFATEKKPPETEKDFKKDNSTQRSSYTSPSNGSTTKTSGTEDDGFNYEQLDVKPGDQVSFTSEACPNRVDLANLQVYPQSSLIKSVNGEQTDKGACQDSGLPTSIMYSYNQCSPDVVLGEQKVYAMKRPYYIENGEQKFLGDCVRDPERLFSVKENFSCTPLIDLNAKTVKEQSSIYYDDDTGRSVVISECQPRETTRTFELKSTYDTCTYRPDPEAGIAYQQEKMIYEKDGAVLSVTDCTDSEMTYPIEKEFCEYKEDWSSGKVIKMERSKINSVQGVFYLTDCLPAATSDIKETQDGCENLHKDYFDAKYSKGFTRFYHEEKNKRLYLTECAEANISYPHQFVIEDWEADFDRQEAVAKMATYIELPTGRIQIKAPEIHSDSLRVPLSKQGEEIIGTGVYSYKDCAEYEKVQKKVTYLLPNSLTVSEFLPVPEPIYKSNVCTTNTDTMTIWGGGQNLYNDVGFACEIGTLTLSRTHTINHHTNEHSCSAWSMVGANFTWNLACWHSGPQCAGKYYNPEEAQCNPDGTFFVPSTKCE